MGQFNYRGKILKLNVKISFNKLRKTKFRSSDQIRLKYFSLPKSPMLASFIFLCLLILCFKS
jgi:hypothetical protein